MEDCCTQKNVIRICLGICMGGCKLSSQGIGRPFNPVCGEYEHISRECCALLHPNNSTFNELDESEEFSESDRLRSESSESNVKGENFA